MVGGLVALTTGVAEFSPFSHVDTSAHPSEKLTWFRFGLVSEKYVITSDTGAGMPWNLNNFSSLIRRTG